MKYFPWHRVFNTVLTKRPPISERQLARFVATVLQPVTPEERDRLELLPDAVRWKFPKAPIPPNYLDFLRWSNGGTFRNGDRLFQFFPAIGPVHGVRTMMLIYGVPEYTPGILPFAFNGGGTFYAFDLRGRRERRECPIVGAQCCVPKGAYSVATSFLRACQGRTFID